jgi:hypothetical protein
VPRHIARLVTRLVAPHVVDYSASRRLVVDYSASRRLVVDYSPPPRVRVPRHVARLVTRHVAPLIVDYSASRKLVVDNSTSRRLVVDYFASATRLSASARRAARHAACRAARRRLLRLAKARGRLLFLRRASGCLGTSRGLSRGSSSTTLPPLRVRVPQHVARLIMRLVAPLVVDYSASRRLVVD